MSQAEVAALAAAQVTPLPRWVDAGRTWESRIDVLANGDALFEMKHGRCGETRSTHFPAAELENGKFKETIAELDAIARAQHQCKVWPAGWWVD